LKHSLYQVQTQRKNISLELESLCLFLPSQSIRTNDSSSHEHFDNAFGALPKEENYPLSREVNGQVELAVQDSAPLKAEDLDRIFNRFYRTDASRQREDGGSGLGLAIAKSIVQAHDGQVSAVSEDGQGLKVIVMLPKSPE
jgi:signal transduction histidine kinase